jgi:hypothetical protein
MESVMSGHGSCHARIVLVLLLTGATACGGGGGGSSGSDDLDPGTANNNPAVDFFLTDVALARPVFSLDGSLDPQQPLVNPASLLDVDPLTGATLPGFPRVLVEGTELSALAAILLEQITDPLTPQTPMVPRNAALVLGFSQAPDPATLGLDHGDPDAPGKTSATSHVRVAFAGGSPVAARVLVDPTDDRRLVLLPHADGPAAWPASPLTFDTHGNASEDPQGVLRVRIGEGSGPFTSKDGRPFEERHDHLGSDARPLPFNPGNALLDAIVQQTEAGVVGFNGFLPDLTAPRIVRPVTLQGTVASVLGGELRDVSLPEPPNVTAQGGAGEWARALLVVHSAGGVESRYVLGSNTLEAGGTISVLRLAPGEVFDAVVAPGDAYTVRRTEAFEPIPPPLPSDPQALAKMSVDPVNWPRDPDDPQDAHNSDLRRFVRVYDEHGLERTDVWDPITGVFTDLPPRSSLALTFSEPMDALSLRPYESLFVVDASLPVDDPGFQDMRPGRTRLSTDGRTVTFEPFLEDQVDPDASRFVGFGGTAADLRLVLRTVPEADALADLAASALHTVLEQLVDPVNLGVVGCRDLGGRGLGLPPAMLDQSEDQHFLLSPDSPGRGAFPPAVDLSIPFTTLGSDDPDVRVLVHRFMGQPETSIVTYDDDVAHDTVTVGVAYEDFPELDLDGDGTVDRRFLYGPDTLEVGLGVAGRLTGASAETLEHIIDDFNRPKNSPFASPNGEDFLLANSFGVSLPFNSGYGARFQQIFRAGDASPSWHEFKDTTLDLVGLAWSPRNDTIHNTALPEMEMLVGLSGVNKGRGPSTAQENGIPLHPDTGLVSHFDCNVLDWLDECQPNADIKQITSPALKEARDRQPPLTTVIKPGTPYVLNSANLFKPANAGSSNGNYNLYLDYPTFNAGVDPAFGQDDVFSFPYDSRFPMLVEQRIEAFETLPSTANAARFSPGIFSSVMPRFRVWSQGQHPYAWGAPNVTLFTGFQKKHFRAGEGGPLIEPGTQLAAIEPLEGHNGMPVIPLSTYILPPYEGNQMLQPEPDWENGDPAAGNGCITKLPVPNSDPYMNWYHANGMLQEPLPNTTAFPGPQGQPATYFAGYGPAAAASGGDGCVIPTALGNSNTPMPVINEPGMTAPPGSFGDNSRYYTLFKYRKRVSLVESPTVALETGVGGLRFLRPQIDPPLIEVDPAASLRVEFRAGTQIDFSLAALESGYVDVTDPTFAEALTGLSENRRYVKFRASFGVAKGQTRPPTIETIVIPYELID